MKKTFISLLLFTSACGSSPETTADSKTTCGPFYAQFTHMAAWANYSLFTNALGDKTVTAGFDGGQVTVMYAAQDTSDAAVRNEVYSTSGMPTTVTSFTFACTDSTFMVSIVTTDPNDYGPSMTVTDPNRCVTVAY